MSLLRSLLVMARPALPWSFLLILCPALHAQATTRESVDSAGAQGNGDSVYDAISADGRYVTFASSASNLVPGDTNATMDVFVRDRILGTTVRASVDSAGGQGNDYSAYPTISYDGRYVAFQSAATNLVTGGSGVQVYVHDMLTGATKLASVDSSGTIAGGGSNASISGNGRFVAFESGSSMLVTGDSNFASDIFVHDLFTGSTERVSVSTGGAEGNISSHDTAISADGRYVAFDSFATNLVAGDTNGSVDTFVRDRLAGTTTRVSVDSAGAEGNANSLYPALSGDGHIVAFRSVASNLVAGDTNGRGDIFAHDITTGATEVVSVSSTGVQGTFGDGDTASVSEDGRRIAFSDSALGLVPGDTNAAEDVFVRDRALGTTTRVSVDSSGAQAQHGASQIPAISGDGRFVSFSSRSDDLVPGDTNNSADVFVHDDGSAALAPWTNLGSALAGIAGPPSLLGTGALLAGSTNTLSLSSAAPSAPCLLVYSFSSTPIPALGGQLVAFPPTGQLPLGTSPAGALTLPFKWPAAIPPGTPVWFQILIADAATPHGASFSNAERAVGQ